jgi:hypothetical protein
VGYATAAGAMSVEPDKIDKSARLVLVAMALMVRDKATDEHPAQVYYGGRIRIAAMLGRYPTEVVLRGIRRDLAALIAVGVVERIEGGRNGQSSVYRLRVKPVHISLGSVDKPP